MTTTKPKPVHLLVCEDVRDELHGKHTVVGIYDGGMVNVHAPLPVPVRLAFRCEIQLASAGEINMEMRVTSPSGSVVGQLTGAKGQIETVKWPSTFYFPPAAFLIGEPGEHKIIVTINGIDVPVGSFVINSAFAPAQSPTS